MFLQISRISQENTCFGIETPTQMLKSVNWFAQKINWLVSMQWEAFIFRGIKRKANYKTEKHHYWLTVFGWTTTININKLWFCHVHSCFRINTCLSNPLPCKFQDRSTMCTHPQRSAIENSIFLVEIQTITYD